MNNLDYIRLGLGIKTKWPQIDFETVEIIEVPFGKARFEFPVLATEIKAHLIYEEPPSLFRKEIIDMQRWRMRETEFTVGCALGLTKLLIGIKGEE